MDLLVIKLFSSNYARYPYFKAFDNLMTILFAAAAAAASTKENQNAIRSMFIHYRLIYL